MHFVYGGVALIPKPQEYRGAHPTAQAMGRKAESQPNITRMSTSELNQKQRQASSQMPTGEQTSNVSQQYRFFQYEQAKRDDLAFLEQSDEIHDIDKIDFNICYGACIGSIDV